MEKFNALQISKTDDGQAVGIVQLGLDDLMEGDVTIRVSHSTINYKDALAITGKGRIVRHWPMIPGADLAGIVENSSHPKYKTGDAVLLNGWGVGEAHFGGHAQMARVNGDWLIPQPDGLSAADAMAIGTAGYTSMLCVLELEDRGVSPDKGDIVVTGAAGGVGSVAIAILAKLGYRVIASTGRASEADYLKNLGAAEIIDRSELSEPARALDKPRWAGGIDCVGSHTLANVIARTSPRGTVVACGLAQGMDLPSSVAPFILRAVALIGVDSVTEPYERRVRAYERLVTDLDLEKLSAMTTTIPLDEVEKSAHALMDGKIRGRIVVDLG